MTVRHYRRYDWESLEPSIITMHAAGTPVRDIASKLGVQQISLQSWMVRTGLISGGVRRHWTAAEKESLTAMIDAGRALTACAKALRRSNDSVIAMARQLGLVGAAATASDAPQPHKIISRSGDDPDVMAVRIARYVADIGAAAVVRLRRGIIAAAIPGTRVHRAAEREGCMVGTYTEGVRREWIADDLREACR